MKVCFAFVKGLHVFFTILASTHLDKFENVLVFNRSCNICLSILISSFSMSAFEFCFLLIYKNVVYQIKMCLALLSL